MSEGKTVCVDGKVVLLQLKMKSKADVEGRLEISSSTMANKWWKSKEEILLTGNRRKFL